MKGLQQLSMALILSLFLAGVGLGATGTWVLKGEPWLTTRVLTIYFGK